MQPVVLERKGLILKKSPKHSHFLAFSVLKVSDLENISQNIVFEWCSAISKLLIKTSMWEIQPVVWKVSNLGNKTSHTYM